MITNPKIDSSLHILKGAVQKVLGASVTTGVFQEGDKGRLTVEFTRKPSDEEMQQVEGAANSKIAENAPIDRFEMDRTDAEQQFGNAIYDKFPVPSHIRKLTIVRIADWNINCCIGTHTKTTGEVGKISIESYRFRNAKQQLEISFSVP